MVDLRMSPAPGSSFARYVGDRFAVRLDAPHGGRAFLRTNLGRARVARAEVVARAGLSEQETMTFAGASWRDIPLREVEGGYQLDIPLLEVGHFRAKAYFVDDSGMRHWPAGDDLSLSVHPNHIRTANTIYCAFARAFGPNRTARASIDRALDARVDSLEERGYSVIPQSGKLRELTAFVPHVFDTLSCRILHLLPIGPTPTVYARMGRFGSPYAQLDLTAIDPALVEFDRRTTAVDQFRELADAVHRRSGMLFLDVVLNHTGWGSRLLDEHPDWFVRGPDGRFVSPGAWGVTWGDLVELDHSEPALWETIADALLVWCRRGVDGFRCDAAYMVPLSAWQYVVARVREEFPNCVFLVEGLGGAWEATATLLTEGGMQWAYSELFQSYAPEAVSGYVDHALRASRERGVLVHYAETHDNDRLAARGIEHALLRCRLTALASHAGGFGFTSGVEWLAKEKIDVHEARGLAWGNDPNLITELGRLDRLLAEHPCFFEGAIVERVSAPDSRALVLSRGSAEGRDHVLVLANLDESEPADVTIPIELFRRGGEKQFDLLGQSLPRFVVSGETVTFTLRPAHAACLAAHDTPIGLAGEEYRTARAQAAFAYECFAHRLAPEDIGPADFRALAALVARDPLAFVGALPFVKKSVARIDPIDAAREAVSEGRLPAVVEIFADGPRTERMVPPDHALVVRDRGPFRYRFEREGMAPREGVSTPVPGGHVAALPPASGVREIRGRLEVRRHAAGGAPVVVDVRELARDRRVALVDRHGVGLLTNGRGAMVRMRSNLGSVESKYDALLAANLHPSVPSDRHVFVKRLRAWANADGFLTPLDDANRERFTVGSSLSWSFAANAGDGRVVDLNLDVTMVEGENAVRVVLSRPKGAPCRGSELPFGADVRVTLRFDLEDRGYHEETFENPASREHFARNSHPLEARPGFVFSPAADRTLVVLADGGSYHQGAEWTRAAHPIEATRGMTAEGHAFSPGWFEIRLEGGDVRTVVLVAGRCSTHDAERLMGREPSPSASPRAEGEELDTALERALDAFVVRRGEGETIIAGYPWFLDWGRDSLIVARGLLASGRHETAVSVLRTFGRLERQGTLPNAIFGDATDNRETSDAPFWYALACEDAVAALGPALYDIDVGDGRTIGDVLVSIATHLVRGAPNGVRIDPESALVYSPAHFTWMDTNYPACTPRRGYPIELAAMFIRFLRQLERMGREIDGVSVSALAARATDSLERFYRNDLGCFADVLHGGPETPSRSARPDDHIRPNQLFAVALGLVRPERARAVVATCARTLLVPGALRSLAPREVAFPLAIEAHGRVLGDPHHPYRGRYEGDEDTSRKLAYHNGTAWVWLLPTFVEALLRAWDGSREARVAGRAILGSVASLMEAGTIGSLPEILDGDPPHAPRGCDAQAFSVSEALRVHHVLARLEGRAGAPAVD